MPYVNEPPEFPVNPANQRIIKRLSTSRPHFPTLLLYMNDLIDNSWPKNFSAKSRMKYRIDLDPQIIITS